MAALVVKSRKNKKVSRRDYCEGACPGMRSGVYVIEILGYPAGSYCPSCAKDWTNWWESALEKTDA